MSTRSVYIIEDSLTMRAMMEALIDNEERLYVCGVAGSAEQALKALADDRPDIILLDLDLPGMSGLDFLDALRLQVREQWRSLRIIIVSSRTTRLASICGDAFIRGAVACFDKAQLTVRAKLFISLLQLVGTADLIPKVFRGVAVTLPVEHEPEPDEEKPAPTLRSMDGLRSGPITYI